MFCFSVYADELHGAGAGPIERANGPTEHFVEQLHWQRDRQCYTFSLRESEKFGCLLTQHDVQRRYDRKRDKKGNGVSPWIRKAMQRVCQETRDRRLTNPSQSK